MTQYNEDQLEQLTSLLEDAVADYEASDFPPAKNIAHLLRFFRFDHYRDNYLKPVAANCAELAVYMVNTDTVNPELTAGLRKLLEAKDCFVRSQIDD